MDMDLIKDKSGRLRLEISSGYFAGESEDNRGSCSCH